VMRGFADHAWLAGNYGKCDSLFATMDSEKRASQYRRIVAVQRSSLKYAWLYWAVPLIVLALAIFLRWHFMISVLCVITIVSGVIQHWKIVLTLRDYERRLEGRTDETAPGSGRRRGSPKA